MQYNFSDKVKDLEGNAIREIFKALADPEMISFAGGLPSNECLPIQQIKTITNEILSSNLAPRILQYGATEGYLPFRETGLKYLERVGIKNKTIDNIIAISGGQQGIDLMCKCLLNKGDTVLVENPTYLAVLHILKTYEAKAVGVDSFEDGIDIVDLEEKIKKHNPKFFYVVPNFSNPTGKTLSIEKRKAIYDICKKHNVVILEDDPYRELRYSNVGLPSISSFDNSGLVVYITSFSKTIAPGLRVGYAVGDEKLISKMTIAKQAVDVHTTTLSQAVVNSFITSGELDKQIEKSIPLYQVKKDAMINALKKYMPKSFKYTNPEGGLFIWGEFDKDSGNNVVDTFKVAIENKVAYVCGKEFYASGQSDTTLRLNFSNSTLEQIDIGVEKLASLFK